MLKEGDLILVVRSGVHDVVNAHVRVGVSSYLRWEAWSARGYVRSIWTADEGKLWARGRSVDVRAALLLARSAA